MTAVLDLPKPTILWVEDDPGNIKASLNSLKNDGYVVHGIENVEDSRQCLRAEDIQVILLDAYMDGEYDGGMRLITGLKRGELGPRNAAAPFGFVTASKDWVDEDEMSALPGYLGTRLKGGSLTPDVKELIVAGTSGDSWALRMQRVPLRVADVRGIGGMDSHLLLSIPAWSVDEHLRFPVAALPTEMSEIAEQLVGRWYIAKLNLYHPDPRRIAICGWEEQEPLDDGGPT